MRIFVFTILLSWAMSAWSIDDQVRTNLAYTSDSNPQPNVPQGELIGPLEFHSKIIQNTVRRYWIYVPSQYQASTPASLLVFQDGQRASNPNGSLRVPQVLDNLIAKGAIPVTIGLFVTPGNTSQTYPDNLGMSNPNHRWQEYDVLTDAYARMLIEELIPLVEKEYALTKDPEQRAIAGTSSGAIAAFTAAWHRPDYFRKVYSAIGSYVSIGYRPDILPNQPGGQDYPSLIRRTPIRPLRIFFQDGSNDLDNEWGNWFLANQQMVKALGYANRNADEQERLGPRYEFTYVWTDGEHNDRHAGILLPEALRWLWH
ncbi:alpha/beta hydrolase [Glaciecola sp. 1036]|uniref:alpha/beta hydrolase n=1 Tax=Alteromonadaceae TaxID=72275 RepID=UPI003D0544F0